MADPAKPAEPRRLRWSVPRVDVSTNEWLDMQNDISHSLQLLIRESIQRDGYIDVVNRPVEQLPRRGRPPAEAGTAGPAAAGPAAAAAVDDGYAGDGGESTADAEQVFPETSDETEAPVELEQPVALAEPEPEPQSEPEPELSVPVASPTSSASPVSSAPVPEKKTEGIPSGLGAFLT